jgi:isopentenyl phosphate kinase
MEVKNKKTVVLNKRHAQEVENIMNLALDWLGTWDVTGGMKNKEPQKIRVEAMHKMKDAVTALALKAQSSEANKNA